MSGAPRISRGGCGLPSRVVFHAVEGVGKTSFAAHAPGVVFSMTKGETGLLSLIDNGRLPETDHFDEAFRWRDLLADVQYLLDTKTGHRGYAIDTLNGAERLCFEHVCEDLFDGSWKDFDAFGRGVNVALAEWGRFITLLDELRQARRIGIICLAHTKVSTYKNPLGEDYDRFTPAMHAQTWGVALKWADIVLFGNFDVKVKKGIGAKGKGEGGDKRTLYTRRTAAYDAKERAGLPPSIPLGARPEEGWANFAAALKRSRVDSAPREAQAEHRNGTGAEPSQAGEAPAANGQPDLLPLGSAPGAYGSH